MLTTFLTLKLHSLSVNDISIGALSTFYYIGFMLGAFKLEKIILRCGHNWSYLFFAFILALTSISHGLYINVPFWLMLRFFSGIATAGLYIIIESWIISASNKKIRGLSLAFYMISLSVAQAMGQWLLNFGDANKLTFYIIAAVLALLSAIPLLFNSTHISAFSQPELFSIKKMYKISPSAIATCFASGMLLACIYGLYPVFIRAFGYHISDLATIMGLTILGGMIFQYPMGYLSDLISRRNTIIFLSIVTTCITIFIILFGKKNMIFLSSLSFLLGGSIYCLYPIGLNQACDHVKNNQIISMTQTLLLTFAFGAVIGPIAAPTLNLLYRQYGILIFIIIVNTLLAAFILYSKRIEQSIKKCDRRKFRTSNELMPISTEANLKKKNNTP